MLVLKTTSSHEGEILHSVTTIDVEGPKYEIVSELSSTILSLIDKMPREFFEALHLAEIQLGRERKHG